MVITLAATVLMNMLLVTIMITTIMITTINHNDHDHMLLAVS